MTFERFDKTFTLIGGVNLPKVVDCVGSDGVRYRQLVKGKDDLRQDAVMQQVFATVNALLRQDVGSRRRRLRIGCVCPSLPPPLRRQRRRARSTYRVVPLTPYVGLVRRSIGARRRVRLTPASRPKVEWVQDTLPLGAWLIDEPQLRPCASVARFR